MRAFWADAEGIFETARGACQSGAPDCDLAILIGPQGGIHMLEAAGWALTSLLAEHNVKTIYRVTRERGSVRLEGRSGSETCLLRSESPAETARHLLARVPAQAAVAPACQLPALLPEAFREPTCPPKVELCIRFA